VHDVARVAAEDAVVLVLALVGETGVAAFSHAVEVTPVVPATRLLTQVAGERALVPELWAGDHLGGLVECPVASRDHVAVGDFGDRGQRTDTQTAVRGRRDAPQLRDPAQADHLVRDEHAVAQTPEQVGAAAVDARAAAFELGEGIGE
jgi:hypothetical protein